MSSTFNIFLLINIELKIQEIFKCPRKKLLNLCSKIQVNLSDMITIIVHQKRPMPVSSLLVYKETQSNSCLYSI